MVIVINIGDRGLIIGKTIKGLYGITLVPFEVSDYMTGDSLETLEYGQEIRTDEGRFLLERKY